MNFWKTVRWVVQGTMLITAPFIGSVTHAESPSILYMLHCMGCHLQDGTGKPGEVPDLAQYSGRFASLPEGRAYLIQVPGAAQAALSDADLALLTNWILATFSKKDLPEPFLLYDATEVSRYRHVRLTDVNLLRTKLINSLSETSRY